MCNHTDFLFCVIFEIEIKFLIIKRSLEGEHTGCNGLDRRNGYAGKPFHRRWFIIDEERASGSSTTRGLSETI